MIQKELDSKAKAIPLPLESVVRTLVRMDTLTPQGSCRSDKERGSRVL